jgi:hypothetical protein
MTFQDSEIDVVEPMLDEPSLPINQDELNEVRGKDNQQMERIHNMKIDPNDTRSIVEAALPYFTDDTNKAKYLSYRLNYFSVLESCHLCGFHIKTIHRWRDADPIFRKLDVEDMGGLRKQLSAQFLDMEYTRNFRLLLAKDFKVILKSLGNDELSKNENDYLLRLRGHYSPQNLAMIKQLVGGGTIDKPFDFTKLTLTIRKEKETLEIKSE